MIDEKELKKWMEGVDDSLEALRKGVQRHRHTHNSQSGDSYVEFASKLLPDSDTDVFVDLYSKNNHKVFVELKKKKKKKK